jgi:hypothetical protein
MKKSNNDNIKHLHRNKPQLRAIAIDANIEVDLWGRRTGKSVRIAEWLKTRSEQMPRCNLVFLSTSYKHLKKKILPEIELAWENMGWIKGIHYWKNKYPPPELGIPQPYRTAEKEDAYFTIWGGVIKLASMDKNAPSAGDANDGIAVDECRMIDGERLQTDILPSVSGTNPKWRGKSYYCSKLFVSDKPRDAKGKWLLEYRKQMNPVRAELVLQIELKRSKLITEKLVKKISKKREKEIDTTIETFDKALNTLRKDLVYVSEASTMDNIDIIGVDTIKSMKRTLTPRNFKISVQNKDGMEVTDNMYVDLDEDVHGYFANNDLYFRNSKELHQFKYEWFTDIKKNLGFDIAIDTNFAGNCVSVRQIIGNESRLVLVLFNIAPDDHKDLMVKLADYLEPHPTKKIRFIYNNTFIAGKKWRRPYIAQECVQTLQGKGFKVTEEYIGQAYTHEKTMYQSKKAFRGELPMKYTFNRVTCSVWYDSAKQTQMVQSESEGLKKNKKSETDGTTPYHEATHIPESFDQFIQFDTMKIESSESDVYDLMKGG